ncbi:MAG: gluconate 2-dehydrogenase subunit 3 family protein [Candidatus Acidiferrum sp.]
MGGISRREAMQKLMAAIAAGGIAPVVATAHPIELYRRIADGGGTLGGGETALDTVDWRPIFLSTSQDQLLVALAETMVPGSTTAQVDRFIDLLLSVDSTAKQKEFVAALTTLDEEAKKTLQKAFAELSAGDREKALTDFSEAHRGEFGNLKEWIVGAYYSSEQGMKELGWDGNFAFPTYPSCERVAVE